MQPFTRQVFNNYLRSYANAIGNPNAAKNEAAHFPPLAQQKTYLRVAEQAEFLKKVNHVPVNAQIGQRVGIGVSQPLASRTNTRAIRRHHTDRLKHNRASYWSIFPHWRLPAYFSITPKLSEVLSGNSRKKLQKPGR